jgi:uncharacterized protein (TIGR01777 family)
MRIIIPGGSGLIGQALGRVLAGDGHEVWLLSRNPGQVSPASGMKVQTWDGKSAQGWANLLEGAGAVINLAGENIGEGPWSDEKKKRIRASRILAGQAIVEGLRSVKNGPKILLQSSAIGCYGTSETATFAEDGPFGKDFQSSICVDWERSTAEVEAMGVRRVILRTGLYLTPEGGVLPRLMLPFKLFVGGPLGSGKQWYSWIHPVDYIQAVRFLLQNEQAAGPFNLTAPGPVTMAEFGHTLAAILRRPYLLPVPAFALKLALGEMSSLVLEGQRVIPQKLAALGFKFRFEQLQLALQDLLKR